ncbi:TetR/AcrR family transcriptional regulator [Geitlerinema sp. PCC 9228]|jgi:AcrR family transcriptional regulator|uniref:TetR/AcrR family transcriptional regulator n=1 Tax=Geitlerinema sp. PCC 9228 TaxID=111611 RepID=UPI0008F9CD43|nr:TetR/AcrR family transcriptional regulator [Geitlerinema sp. PCC 9228]
MGVSTTRSAEKKKAILNAAADLFVERGYDGVSVDAIVKEVGGSKANIYNYFGGKQGLFRAIVEDMSQQILSPLADAEIGNLPPREALTAIGKQVMSVVLSDRAIGLLRIVIAENRQFPELGSLFLKSGPQPCHQCLAQYLEKQQQLGTLKPCDSQQAAMQFIGMFLGSIQMQRLLGTMSAPDQQQIETLVDSAVTTFLEGYSCSE